MRPLDPSRAQRLEQRPSESESRLSGVSRERDTFERTAPTTSPDADTNANKDADTDADTNADSNARGEPLSDQEQHKLDQMRTRDREVRTHEQAHGAGAGGLAQGGPNYTLTVGPDGNRYATGGHVNIDTSEASTPEQTIQKAAQIRRAALAPADPSSKDRQVAAKASQMEAKARQELASDERSSDTVGISSDSTPGIEKAQDPRPRIDVFA